MFFYSKAHRDAYHAWIMERIRSGELAETLRRRHMKIEVEPQTLELLRKLKRRHKRRQPPHPKNNSIATRRSS